MPVPTPTPLTVPDEVIVGSYPTEPDLYWYRCEVAKAWTDGDTIRVHFDHGRKLINEDVKLRLARIDAFGNTHPKKAQAVELCNTVLPIGKKFYLRTVPNTKGVEKEEKWGRWLVEVFIQVDDTGPLMNFNDILVKQGLALYWEGDGPHPTGEIVR
jgi:endonuclease YncB( thermonuclease family)